MAIPNVRDPIIWALAGLLGIVAIALGVSMWQTQSLKVALAEQKADLVAMTADRDVVKAQRDDSADANKALTEMVQTQGLAIMALKEVADARQAKATAAAREVLNEPMRLPSGHGPKVMNNWMLSTFRPAASSPPASAGIQTLPLRTHRGE